MRTFWALWYGFALSGCPAGVYTVIVAGRYRDVEEVGRGATEDRRGRNCIAVIGIDRYRDPAWQLLHNAVGDARGVLALFTQLGFERVGPQLLDERATGEAIHRLAVDDLAELGLDDSLIVFFAGHGHTVIRSYHGGTTVKDGYLIVFAADGAVLGVGVRSIGDPTPFDQIVLGSSSGKPRRSTEHPLLMRFKSDGTLDTGFGVRGALVDDTPGRVNAAAVDAAGRVVIVGETSAGALIERYSGPAARGKR